MKNTAVVVSSFDGYRDVWPVFFACKDRFWKDCEYPTYLVSNFQTMNERMCIPVAVGEETNWCDRMEKALEKISCDYVILLLEDYLIGAPIPGEAVERYLQFMERNQACYLRLIDIPIASRKTVFEPDNPTMHKIQNNEQYGVNLQPSIWKKEYLQKLLSQIGGTRSAWEFEVTLLKQSLNQPGGPMEGCYALTENLLHIHNGILKGKWFPSEVAYFRKLGISIDTSARPTLSFLNVAEYRIRMVLREMVTPKQRKQLKKILKKFGMKFASDE